MKIDQLPKKIPKPSCTRNSLFCQIRQWLSWILLWGAVLLGVMWGLGMLSIPIVIAAIQQFEEAPGQLVHQTRQTLTDQDGNRWQAIAFKRTTPSGEIACYLRLVGFPNLVDIDRNQPLTVISSLGETTTAIEISSNLAGIDNPPTNVGQYDLQVLLADLKAEIPMQLLIPTTEGKTALIPIPSSLVQEWQAIAAYM